MEQNAHILIVGDDREIRELLARFLEKNQLRVTAVRDAPGSTDIIIWSCSI